MLKVDIWGTFCCIAFENPFNGNRGLLKIEIMISHKKKSQRLHFNTTPFFSERLPLTLISIVFIQSPGFIAKVSYHRNSWASTIFTIYLLGKQLFHM